MEKLLPQNLEAEAGTLGSLIIDPEAITQVADFLRAQDFYRDAHRAIYEAICHLYEEHTPADLTLLCDELERQGRLKDIGGAGYITSLINHVPTSGNVEYYGRIVERAAIFRRLVHAAGLIAAMAYEGGDADEALVKAAQLILDIGQRRQTSRPVHVSEVMEEVMADLEYAHEYRGSILGVPTGFEDIDSLTNGLQKKELIILAARPGMGKSSLALCIGYHAAKKYGKRVIVFSLEMGRKQLGQKLVSMLSKVDSVRLRNGWIEDHEWDRIVAAKVDIAEQPFWIDDASDSPIVSMRTKLQRMQSEGNLPDLIIIDYLGLIDTPEVEGKKYENRVQQVSAISKGLLRLAKDFDRPVLAAAQLNRANEARGNKRPQLADLRDSGSIEQDANQVWFIYRQDYYAEMEKWDNYTPTNIAEVTIAKNRMGPCDTFELYFQKELTRFYPLSEMQSPPLAHARTPYRDDLEEEREVD